MEEQEILAVGQNIAQNCIAMRIVETIKYWTAVSPGRSVNDPPRGS